jgi:hypothetical protein
MEELLARPDNSYKACRSQENKLHRGLEKQKTADELFARPTTVSIGDCPSFRFRFKAGHRPWSAPNTYRGSVVRLNEGAPFQRVTSPEEPASGRPRNSFSSLLPSYSKVGFNPQGSSRYLLGRGAEPGKHKLGYTVTLKSTAGQRLPSLLSYERLWGTGGRWDYLTEENAPRCVTFFGGTAHLFGRPDCFQCRWRCDSDWANESE